MASDVSLTQLGNSASKSSVSEFLVHVDCFSSGQVSENDAIVLDNASVLFVNLLNRDDLALDLSDFVLSLHVVPELRLSKDWVLGENSHSVESRIRVLITWKTSADNEELSNL
jgi:hypothetical protein